MKKKPDAETILIAACSLKQADAHVQNAFLLVCRQITKAKSLPIYKASNAMYGLIHSLESSWVQAVAREVGCSEHEVPFDCPEKARAFFESRKGSSQ